MFLYSFTVLKSIYLNVSRPPVFGFFVPYGGLQKNKESKVKGN